MTTIAVVGLGAMGGRIAGRLLSQGNAVFGTNRTKSKADTLIEQGMHWCDSPRQAAEAADVVISMVTDSDALQAVTAGPEGILAGLAAGDVYIEMSTVSPQASRDVAAQVALRGASMLAAPVSGTVTAVEEGSLAIIVGGDAGHALLLKLAININLAVQMLAFSEGVLLAERGGIERGLAVDVLTRSAIGSPMLQARGPLLRELPDQAWFDVRLMQKDLRLVLDSARNLGVPLPSTGVADELLSAAIARGYEHRDIAVLFQVLSELAAVPAGREREVTTA
jgi:3-hydroxyisobutyrate dehydrogenase-like beta-hydroxyacid dehydrogenase